MLMEVLFYCELYRTLGGVSSALDVTIIRQSRVATFPIITGRKHL